MPSHSRYNGQQFSADDPRSKGAFSRQHQTGEAFEAYQADKEADEQAFWRIVSDNKKARAKRGDAGQLKMLDGLFGKGKGAKKERKRLNDRISKAKAKAKAKNA